MARIKAYFKLDLYFFEHPKVVDLSHPATVLYIASIAYCNRRQTDGHIAQPVLRRMIELDDYGDGPSHHQLAEELVKAGLWEPAEGGWQVHDFLDHNESSEEREDRRAEEAARKRAARAAAAADKDRPDGPEPPSGPPSGNVLPDTTGRPGGHNRPSVPITEQNIALPEQSDSRGKVNTIVALAAPARPDSEDIRAVFDAWKATLPSGSRPRLTEARRDAVKTALARYDREDVLDAARGWVNDPWPERAQQNDLAQLLHMGSKRKPANILERMRDLWRHGPPPVIGKQTMNAMRISQQMRQHGQEVSNPELGRVGDDRGRAERQLPAPADRTADGA